MFDSLLLVFLNNVMLKNIDSKPRMVEPKHAILDGFLQIFGLARTQSLKVSSNSELIDRPVLRLWEEARL